MSREKECDRILDKWAKQWKEENLSPEIRTLISQTNHDLYFGPINDGACGDPANDNEELKSYPGFTTAVKQITQALRDLPSNLYLDTETEEVLESEPEGEKCEDCDGEGSLEEGDNKITCHACRGRGGFDACGDWWHIEREDIRIAIVGKELASYVR